MDPVDLGLFSWIGPLITMDRDGGPSGGGSGSSRPQRPRCCC